MAAQKFNFIIKGGIEKWLLQVPRQGSHQYTGMGESGEEQKVKWKKKGEGILFYFILKIYIGLNKLRGSAQGILDLGFETERTPLLLAIWLL